MCLAVRARERTSEHSSIVPVQTCFTDTRFIARVASGNNNKPFDPRWTGVHAQMLPRGGAATKSKRDLSPDAQMAREAAIETFEGSLRQAAMEYDSLDSDGNHSLDFREFSRLVREREMGVHTEEVLQERFKEIDADGSGTIDADEYIGAALKDAFTRSAACLEDIFSAWDVDSSGRIDKDEAPA